MLLKPARFQPGARASGEALNTSEQLDRLAHDLLDKVSQFRA